MAEGEDDDKQHEPTQKKLDDARKKGEVARSADVTTAAAYGGFVLVALSVGGASLDDLGRLLTGLVARADTLSASAFAGSGLVLLGTMLTEVAGAISVWFAVPAVLALLATIAQRSFVVAPEKLQPKLNRISPLANGKNKFGRAGLFEFAKSFVKLVVYAVILGLFLGTEMPLVLRTLALSPQQATMVLFDLGIRFFIYVVITLFVIGAVDFLWQRAEHLRKNRMSRKELMDEAKQNEGDPYMKQARRQRGYDIAMNQMLADVPDADVIVVNPTHYAVALKWNRQPGQAPICVAKGVDEMAARIREVAAEAGVPIHSDPPTARALFATVEIGEEIRPEHYRAVAAAIRFSEDMRRRMRARLGRAAPAGKRP